MNKLWLVSVAVAFGAFGCVEVDDRPTYTDAQRKQASIAKNICLRNAVAKIDDGTSDASTIAATALQICRKEAGVEAYMWSAALSPAAQKKFLQMTPEAQLQLATETVLLMRAE